MKTKTKIITSFKIWIVIYPSITLFLHFFAKAFYQHSLYTSERSFLQFHLFP